MPITRSAKKKMRQDKTRTEHNSKIRDTLKALIKKMRREPSAKALQEVSSALDKAVKTKLIHANKAARLKSRLSKNLASGKVVSTAQKKSTKKAKKPVSKKTP